MSRLPPCEVFSLPVHSSLALYAYVAVVAVVVVVAVVAVVVAVVVAFALADPPSWLPDSWGGNGICFVQRKIVKNGIFGH